jgi:hypothetical protein
MAAARSIAHVPGSGTGARLLAFAAADGGENIAPGAALPIVKLDPANSACAPSIISDPLATTVPPE